MCFLARVFGDFEAEGTVFGCINKNDFQNLRFIAPPLKIVMEYEGLVAPIDNSIEKKIVQSQTLEAIRNALLPKIISGELRVADSWKYTEGT
jgi:type I restriction enzyme S subunit